MQIIPIVDTYAQTVKVQLAGLTCVITLEQKSTGMFCTMYTNDRLIIAGTVCVDRTRMVRSLYLGFPGDIMFVDTQGGSDPSSLGLGSRFVLYFLELSDL